MPAHDLAFLFACKLWGLCDDGCAQSYRCQESGHCTSQNGACVVGSERDCKASRNCREHGVCAFDDGECVSDWRPIMRPCPECASRGLCTATGDGCIAANDAECARSAACQHDYDSDEHPRPRECHALGGRCVARNAQVGPMARLARSLPLSCIVTACGVRIVKDTRLPLGTCTVKVDCADYARLEKAVELRPHTELLISHARVLVTPSRP